MCNHAGFNTTIYKVLQSTTHEKCTFFTETTYSLHTCWCCVTHGGTVALSVQNLESFFET